MAKAKRSKKQPTGDYGVGYCRPPVHTRIPKGKVLNPHGCNSRKTDEADAFEKARRRLSRVTIDGDVMMIPSEEAFWLLMMARSMANDKTAAKIVAQEFGARRKMTPPGPPPPTPEELAEREKLSARLVDLLNEKASMKKRGYEMFRVGPDGLPVPGSNAKGLPSANSLDQPVEKPRG